MNAYGKCILHVTFHTKYSLDVLPEAHEQDLFEYIGTVLKNIGCPPVKIGGYDDHVHVAFDLGRETSISKAVGTLKSNSSRWLKEHGAFPAFTGWQRGYGYYSVSQSQRPPLVRYIERQRIHHGRNQMTFRQEVQLLLDKYGVEYEVAYLPEEG